MKKLIAITILSVGFLWSCQHKSAEQSGVNRTMKPAMDHQMSGSMNHDMGQGHDRTDGSTQIAYYTCPMESHKHISSTKPGSCSECGMALVAAVEVTPDQADYYGCPMPSHSHIRSDSAGECTECGMDLKPLKLKKQTAG